MALALVHWLYNCTATFGSLDAVIAHLARLARHALVVEWIAPDDPMVTFFGHLEWSGADAGPYTRKTFEDALALHFGRVDTIGDVSPTRRLYLARKRPSPVDLSCPLPLRHALETVLSCSRLTSHRGVEVWSRVYDLGDRVVKQATGTMASREGRVLQRLTGAAVPAVLAVDDATGESTLTLAKVEGDAFDVAAPIVAASDATWQPFVAACLDILVALHDAAIAHRDIHRDNVLVCNGRPVLLDFGWATAPGLPVFTPEGFALRMNSSDVHAMGVLLADVACQAGRPTPILTMMTNDDPELRLDDPHLLRALDALLSARHDEPGTAPHHVEGRAPHDIPAIVSALVAQVSARDSALDALRQRVGVLEQQVGHHQQALVSTELALADAERSLQERPSAKELAALHVRLAEVAFGQSATPDALDVPPAHFADALAYAAALRSAARPHEALRVVSSLLPAMAASHDTQRWLMASYMAASLSAALGHDDEALKGFSALLRLDPAGVSPGFRGGAHYHSAMILRRQGAFTAAHDHLVRCLEVLPDHQAARAALAGHP